VRLPVPTLLGIKALLFYALLGGAFFAAPYLNLFFLMLSFLTVLGILTLLWTAGSLRGVSAEVRSIEFTPAGIGAEVRANVDARRRVRGAVSLSLDVEGRGRVAVPAGQEGARSAIDGRLPGWSRGIYAVRSADLTSTWPIGMLRVRRPVSAPGEVVVYPKPADLTEAVSGEGGIGSIFGGSGGGNQPSQLRDYRPGDELRQVHWKATARRDGPVVTEWDGGAGSGAEVVLDRRADPEEFEDALSLLAAATLAAQETKETLTIHTQGLSATYGTGHEPLSTALRFLAGTTALPGDGPPPPPASPEIPRLPARTGRSAG
jgi:uncharacterized protein (DUF58 family)